jgi:dolichyl-phosphate-mannose--protein O-mannosyl transferase
MFTITYGSPLYDVFFALSYILQLPALYFAVLTSAHLLDHFVFTARRLTSPTKNVIFGICVLVIAGTFWWFRGVAFGIDGAIQAHKGLQWRKVSVLSFVAVLLITNLEK